MKFSLINRYISVIAILFPVMLWGQYKPDNLVDKIVAKVDNYIILKSDVESAFLELTSRGQATGPNAKCQVFETLLLNKLLVAKAEIDSVVVSEEEVNIELDRRVSYVVSQLGSEKEVEKFYGKSLAQFKEELQDDIKEQLVIQKMQGIVTENVKVTPKEIKKFFNQIPKDSLPFFSTEVVVGQIIKTPSLSKNQKNIVKSKLLDIRKQIVEGAEFQEMAKKYSQDPGSAKLGGELGFRQRGELVPEFEAVALKLKPGEISQPVESEFGFHLIQLIERRGNKYSTRHILMKPEYTQVDISESTQLLDSLRTQILSDSISFEKAAKDFSEDIETASSGGFFLSSTGSTRVPVDELDPMVFFTIDTMKVGNITKPIPYKTKEGKQSVRILFYKSKTPPHQANLKDDYQKIYTAALNQKKMQELDKWLANTKEEVFIDIDEDYKYCNLLE